MQDPLDNALTILQRMEWSTARFARDCEAAQAELQSLETVAPEEVERQAAKRIAQLKQQLRQLPDDDQL
ncbi:hypothetical protein EKD04_002890 [Chloroflexales bacterium ZM16-3]|nr:hypothetical protein [Chloroflexales bacterium ZM16-3]